MYISPIPESRLMDGDGDWEKFILDAELEVAPPPFTIGSIVQHPFHIISQANIAALHAVQSEEDAAIFAAIIAAVGANGQN